MRHSLELQALAIRTGKTYIEHFPELSPYPVELFVEIEGNPDDNSYYLIGLLVCVNGEHRHHPFWATAAGDEAEIWNAFITKLEDFPDTPIYHYGSIVPEVPALGSYKRRRVSTVQSNKIFNSGQPARSRVAYFSC